MPPSPSAQVRFAEDVASSTAGAPATPAIHPLLRTATRARHRILDEALGRFDLTSGPSYRRFLQVHERALDVLVARCRPAERREFTPLLALLRADLGGAVVPVAPSVAPSVDAAHDPATGLGVAYVLRGSRLGAAFLCRRVGPDLPASYLRYELATPWPAFVAEMEATVARSLHATDTIVDAARRAFDVFIAAADANVRLAG